jgi:hypothetical protein
MNQIQNLSILPSLVTITSPVLSRVRFSEIIGVPEGVVTGWCNKGLLETYKIGKHSLINMEALRLQCREKGLA